MSLNLEKGQRINVSKTSGGSDYFVLGLGWSVSTKPGVEFDLDASAVLCKQQADGNPRPVGEPGFIFYGQLSSSCKGVRHMGDNLTGEGAGDDEQILIDVASLDSGVDQVDAFVTIYQANARKQNFGLVNSAYVRIGTATRGADGNPVTEPGVSNAAMIEIARFNLSDDYSTDTAVQVGSLYKNAGETEWRFKAMGIGLGKVEIGDIFEQYQPGVTAK